MRNKYRFICMLLIASLSFAFSGQLSAQVRLVERHVVPFKKTEIKKGVVFDYSREKGETQTDATKYDYTQNLLNACFKYENKTQILLDYTQKELTFLFNVGPFGTFGDWNDSTKAASREADEKLYGLRTYAYAEYLNRYYYDTKSYALFDISAFGRFDVYHKKQDGTSVDSLGTSSVIDKNGTDSRFRWGLQAKFGYGLGRLNPVNHLMTAQYLLEKYYPGRLFADREIAELAQFIARIKNNREAKAGHDVEKEMKQVADFVNKKMFLKSPDAMIADWPYGEFEPRYEGKRIELVPFFRYYNYDPDFIYGAYMQFEWEKYQNVKWNRNLGVNIKYNRYKEKNWMTGEVKLGWSYYYQLKSRFDFGVKYVPGININHLNDVGTLSHNVIPYLAYSSQLNQKARIKVNFSWRIADGEQFVLPGPAFSLSIYRGKY